MGTNADHQQAWRQRQKLRIAQLEAAKPKKNRLGKNDDPINLLICEASEFVNSFCPRVTATVAALGSGLDAEARDALMGALLEATRELSATAQSLDPRLT